MTDECIICLDEDNLTKVDCQGCNGIVIHTKCFEDLVRILGRKCPHCRGYLKRDNDYTNTSDTDSSMDSEEEERIIRLFNERIINRIQNNNHINNRNNNQNDEINFRCVLTNLICSGMFTILCYFTGAFTIFIYCLMIDYCEKKTNSLLTDPFYVFLKLFIGSMIICFICIGARQQIRLRLSRRGLLVNHIERNRNAVV